MTWRTSSLNTIESIYDGVEQFVEDHLRKYNYTARCALLKDTRITNTTICIPLLGVHSFMQRDERKFHKVFPGSTVQRITDKECTLYCVVVPREWNQQREDALQLKKESGKRKRKKK